jgi:tRNA(adenine34) deaminase
MARLQPRGLLLLHSAGARALAEALQAAAPTFFRGALPVADGGGTAADAAWRAPFPDRGHEAALRALGPIPDGVSGPTPAQAAQLVRTAMGYFAA